MIVFPDPANAPVSKGELVDDVQIKVDPATFDCRRIAVLLPEHIILLSGRFVIRETGRMVTVKSRKIPGHPFAEGMIWYFTQPSVFPELKRF